MPAPWDTCSAYHTRLNALIMRTCARMPATESRESLAQGYPFVVDEGGGAFYGPKIDIKVQPSDPRPHAVRVRGGVPLPLPFQLAELPARAIALCGVWRCEHEVLRQIWFCTLLWLTACVPRIGIPEHFCRGKHVRIKWGPANFSAASQR